MVTPLQTTLLQMAERLEHAPSHEDVWMLITECAHGLREAAALVPASPHNLELRERLAALAHAQWSGWIVYMFSKMYVMPNLGIDPQGYRLRQIEYERWSRQARTPYAELTEAEKESDRKEADRVLALIHPSSSPASSPPQGWQPIETAPKGQALLFYRPQLPTRDRIAVRRSGEWCGPKCCPTSEPTHWMELPILRSWRLRGTGKELDHDD